jgi:hypothetical protein
MPSTGWWTRKVHSVGRQAWLTLCESISAYRRGLRAAALYAELSTLSDAELERRGIARGDLYRLLSDIT